MSIRAVIFDLGGVVLGSPLHAIRDYERVAGLASGCVNRVVLETAPHGAWSRLERGELPLSDFYQAFESDCRAAGFSLCARTMMERIGESAQPRGEMLRAIERLRMRGMKVAALTNNWQAEGGDTSTHTQVLRNRFDVFVESAVEGLRKPDPRIYQLACERLSVPPQNAAFLDDIGINLKSARALGMATIKVDEPISALRELETLLGVALLD